MSADPLWLRDQFIAFEAAVHQRLTESEATMHRKLDALVAVAHHLLTRGQDAMDHAALLDQIKSFDTALDAKIDGAVSEFEAFEATHTAVRESLDDIGAIVSGFPAKLAKLDAIKVPVEGAATGSAASSDLASAGTGSTVTVSEPSTAPTDTLVVSGSVPEGATLSGPGIAPGTTVQASTAGVLTLDTPTVADHAGDGSETLTVTPPNAE